MSTMDLTVDICVIRSGGGTGNDCTKPFCGKTYCFGLMKKILESDIYKVAVDEKGFIRHQYEEHFPSRSQEYGAFWVKQICNKGKLKIITHKQINKGTLVKLKEAHFDSRLGEDFKYVRVAANTDCKILVTHENDYSTGVCRILKKDLKIHVKAPGECY